MEINIIINFFKSLSILNKIFFTLLNNVKLPITHRITQLNLITLWIEIMWYVVWKTYSRLYRLHTFQTLTVEPEGLTYITWCTVGPTELVKAKWSTSEPHAEKQLVICTLLPHPPFHPNLWSYIPFRHFAVSSGAHHPLLLLIFASLHLATSKCCTAIQHFFSVSWLVLSLLFPALLGYQTKEIYFTGIVTLSIHSF